MANRKSLESLPILLPAAALLLCSLILSGPAESQVVSAQPPYAISVFAKSANGYSKPDSIVQWRNSVLVGYGNGVAKDGSDGKSSTIVQYSLSGKLQRMFNVLGHNDGLRIKPETNELWALQNEDGNPNKEPNLVIIDLETLSRKPYIIPSVNGGGGYDDVVFKDDQVFITASNPSGSHFPVLVRLTLAGNSVITETVLNNDDPAINIPTGLPVTLSLTDPDSLAIDPRGNLVLDSQGDSELVFIATPSRRTRRWVFSQSRHPLTRQRQPRWTTPPSLHAQPSCSPPTSMGIQFIGSIVPPSDLSLEWPIRVQIPPASSGCWISTTAYLLRSSRARRIQRPTISAAFAGYCLLGQKMIDDCV